MQFGEGIAQDVRLPKEGVLGLRTDCRQGHYIPNAGKTRLASLERERLLLRTERTAHMLI